MTTLTRAVETLQRADEILQDIVNDLTIEWFTGLDSSRKVTTGKRMVEIAAFLYDKPRDFLHICLWEPLAAMHPEMMSDVSALQSLFRPDAWVVAERVDEVTNWDEFECAVIGDTPICVRPPMTSKIVPIQ